MKRSLALLFLVFIPACLSHDGKLGLPGFCSADDCGGDGDPATRVLIHEVAHLEHHIDKYGRITTKTPAIWGEARLTKHRQEFERQMEAQLNEFQAALNGYVSRSDQAYVAQALALTAAFSGQVAQQLDGAGQPVAAPVGQINAPTITSTNLVPGIAFANPDKNGTFQAPNSTTSTTVFQSQPFQRLPDKQFAGMSNGSIMLEPTVLLDQRARYLNHLHEIRRINEGDDTADSPGYALYLVRVPVSVIPGKHTRIGHGAEITMSINAQYGEELLPKTFRNLVVNDLVDILGGPVFEFAKSTVTWESSNSLLERNPSKKGDITVKYGELTVRQKAEVRKMMPLIQDFGPDDDVKIPYATVNRMKQEAETMKMNALKNAQAGRISVSNGRQTRQPLPPSQVGEIFVECIAALGEYAKTLDKSEGFDAHLILDVHRLLTAEIDAAYELLAQQGIRESVWMSDAPKYLADAIRRNDRDGLTRFQESFKQQICVKNSISPITGALAWAVLVESALLNERLVEDIRTVSAEKNQCCLPNDAWLPFYGPNPPREARQAFQAYVGCRWPTHVFALDPVTQDENIADEFSRRRETQLALSLAFASGRIGANSFSRFTRRLETDMSTIKLHRTAVGFSQGANHFGWRFYPRFQTPPTESNLTVLTRDLLLGGPSSDQELRKAQIEPGIRECIALVIMPSFVSQITVDTRSNWFCLTNPKHTAPNMRETMRLSEAVQRVETNAQVLHGSSRYRPGESQRLLRRIEQLGAEMPMQTFYQQVPFENTLGGFAMFNSGLTDLAPQLTGYYGEPAIKLGEETTLILVGNHFSVHETQVIAGNRRCEYQLLSRRIMRVTIPADAQPVKEDKKSTEVDIHVVTPYGVTSHLRVPATGKANATARTVRFHWAKQPDLRQTTYAVGSDKKADTSATKLLAPSMDLAIQVPSNLLLPGGVTMTLSPTLNDRDRFIVGVTTPIALIFDPARSRLTMSGADLGTLSSGFGTALASYLNSLPALPPSIRLSMRGNVTIGASTFPIESQIEINVKQQ